MRRVAMAALLVLVFLSAACQGAAISRKEWTGMSRQQKTIVVESLRGHGVAVKNKGGAAPKSHSRPTAEYVAEIDAKYSAGDQRNVDQLWEGMADR